MTSGQRPPLSSQTPPNNTGKTEDSAQKPTDNTAKTFSLGDLQTQMSVSDVRSTLLRHAQRGKLPGFETVGNSTIKVLIFAGVYDHELSLQLLSNSNGGCTISPTLRMRRKMPIVMAIVLIVSLFPGLPLTDSMLRAYFRWYDTGSVQTWWWYLPMTLLALPVVWKQLGAARAEAHREAAKVLREIDVLVGATA